MKFALPPPRLRRPLAVCLAGVLGGALACGWALQERQDLEAGLASASRKLRGAQGQLQQQEAESAKLQATATRLSQWPAKASGIERPGWMRESTPRTIASPTGWQAMSWQLRLTEPHAEAFLRTLDPVGETAPGLRVIRRCHLQRLRRANADQPDAIAIDCEVIEYTLAGTNPR